MEEALAPAGGSSVAEETASRLVQPMNYSQQRLQEDAALQLQIAKNEELKLKIQVRATFFCPSIFGSQLI